MGGAKDKTMSLFKTNTTKDYSKLMHIRNINVGGKKPSKLKMQKQSEDNKIKNIRNLFRLKMENETIKGRVIRDNKNLF